MWEFQKGKSFHLTRRSCGEGNGTPLQYSCLENPMDGRAWCVAVHRVAKSQTRLSDFTFTFHLHALEKEIVTHSSVLACRIPGTGEPGGLLSMGLHRVGHDWSDLAAAGGDHERWHDKVGFEVHLKDRLDVWVWTEGNTPNSCWANGRWDGTKLVQGNSGWVILAGALDCEGWLEG